MKFKADEIIRIEKEKLKELDYTELKKSKKMLKEALKLVKKMEKEKQEEKKEKSSK